MKAWPQIRLHQADDQDRDRDGEAGERARRADVDQLLAIGRLLAHADDGTQRPEAERERNEIRQRGVDAVATGRDVMAELMAQQDQHERRRIDQTVLHGTDRQTAVLLDRARHRRRQQRREEQAGVEQVAWLARTGRREPIVVVLVMFAAAHGTSGFARWPASRKARRRGSASSVRAWPSFSNSAFASSEMLAGVSTTTRTWASPRAPTARGKPLPRSRNSAPACVAGGTRMRTRPSRTGTSISAPSVASTGDSGTSIISTSPSFVASRVKNGCERTRTMTCRS